MFRLRRYFSIASLIAFVLVTILLAILYRSIALQMFLQMAENKNVELTKSFANSLWPELHPFIHLTEESSNAALQTYPIIAELRHAVVTQMRGLSVVKVKVYDLDGHTVFSTQVDQIGEDGSGNAGFQSALRGEIVSELTHRDTFSAFEETIENQDLLSTYIPIHQNGAGSPVVSVFELYSNVTPFLAQIDRTQRQLVAAVSGTLALLYGILLLIVSRADTLLKRQHREQLAFSEELRRQQRTVAILQEREFVAREIHDSLGQVLGYVNTQAQAARSLLKKEKVAATDTLLARLIGVAQDAHVELRDFILNLQTGCNSEQQLLARLKAYLEQFRSHHDMQITLEIADDFPTHALSATVAAQLFRIVQEALNNVQKHAHAQHVQISVAALLNGDIQIMIKDDGIGFDNESIVGQNRPHWGLQNMQSRAEEIGATIKIEAVKGTGTTVIVQLPPETDAYVPHHTFPEQISQAVLA